jgi:hypothetical protein
MIPMAEALVPNYRGSYDELALTARWSSAKPKPEVPAAAPPPIAIKGRVLAQVTEYQELWSAMKGRVSELQITMLELDGLSEAADGYSAKILGPSQTKSFGKKSLGRMLRGTGTFLVLVEDAQATAKIKAIAKKRRRPIRPTPRLLTGPAGSTNASS